MHYRLLQYGRVYSNGNIQKPALAEVRQIINHKIDLQFTE